MSPQRVDMDSDLNSDFEQQVSQFEAFEHRGVDLLGPTPEGLEEFNYSVTVPLPTQSRRFESRLRVICPKSPTQPQVNRHPLVVLFHGSGYRFSSPGQMTRPGREFPQTYNAVVACPSYPLVHRHVQTRWPSAAHAAWGVVSWLSRNAEAKSGASLDAGFIVGGHSAGGNLAAVVAGISVFGDDTGKQHTPLARPLSGVFLNCPIILHEDIVPAEFKDSWTSFDDNYESPPLVTSVIKDLTKTYKPDPHYSRWYSPVNALPGIHEATNAHRFPPTWIQACDLDPLRDDAVVFEKMLSGRQYKARLLVFPDDGHAAWNALPIPTKSVNPTLKEGTMEGMKWLLEGADSLA